MAGGWLFESNDVTSRGFVYIITLAIGGFCAVLGVDIVAMAPNSTNASVEEEGCFRALVDVIWGFFVTLFALTISLWGSTKYRDADIWGSLATILGGIFAPIQDLHLIVSKSLWFGVTLWKCHKIQDPYSRLSSFSWLKFICSSLKPWSKSPVRILAACDIVVYTTKNSVLLEEVWLWEEMTIDESEAMVIGENGARSTRNEHYKRKILSKEGRIALIWKEIFLEGDGSKCLPKYDELKFLRGNSGYAVIAIIVQALGYIYAVGFRSAMNLRVAPLEVIGLIFNIILLIKASLYSTCNPCHRPLVIYTNTEWEREFSDGVKMNGRKMFEARREIIGLLWTAGTIFAIVVCTSIVVIHYIVSLMKVTNIVTVFALILFLLGLFLDFGLFILNNVVEIYEDSAIPIYDFISTVLVNSIAYVWAVVVTVMYWKSKKFNTRATNVNLSQLIPFIG